MQIDVHDACMAQLSGAANIIVSRTGYISESLMTFFPIDNNLPTWAKLSDLCDVSTGAPSVYSELCPSVVT